MNKVRYVLRLVIFLFTAVTHYLLELADLIGTWHHERDLSPPPLVIAFIHSVIHLFNVG